MLRDWGSGLPRIGRGVLPRVAPSLVKPCAATKHARASRLAAFRRAIHPPASTSTDLREPLWPPRVGAGQTQTASGRPARRYAGDSLAGDPQSGFAPQKCRCHGGRCSTMGA